ncbi:MAG: exonuclease SbcCD subunit D [Coriobacteriales bacterium]|nr:exonuclease SbcCD subunit D [Coriobacteriales bacterium]
MRFVHTSDLHLGRRLAQMSLEQDTQHVLEQLEELVEQSGSQALVVAGDIFDSPNPPEAAVRQWDRFITRMAQAGTVVLAVSGNHDSGARLSVGSNIIALSGIHIAGELTQALEPVVVDGINFWLVPFLRPADVRSWAGRMALDAGFVINYDTALRLVLDSVRENPAFAVRPNVCVAHQFVTNAGVSPERSDSEHLSLGTLDNVDRRVFEGFDYVALGHIHRPQHIGEDTIRYAGSPLKLSSSEVAQQKSYAVVGIKQGEAGVSVKYRLVPVEPLRDFRLELGAVEDLVRQAKQEDEQRRNDFVHAVVTDDDPIDVVARLRQVWPNLEQVTFDNAVTRAAGVTQAPDEIDLEKDMHDLFAEFFQAQSGKPLADDEQALVDKAFEKVLTKGGDVA